MTGEIPPDENDLSLDPRDPRSEKEPILEITKAIGDMGIVSAKLDESRRELLKDLLKRELTASVEREEITLITDGVPSEAAAEHVAQDVGKRIHELNIQKEVALADWTIPEQWPERGAGNANPPGDS